jgi:hypothetical protein
MFDVFCDGPSQLAASRTDGSRRRLDESMLRQFEGGFELSLVNPGAGGLGMPMARRIRASWAEEMRPGRRRGFNSCGRAAGAAGG